MAVFICYRREDAEGEARAIYNDLAELTDEKHLFFDHEAIGVGEDWRQRIEETFRKVKVVLVVIGPRWLDQFKARLAAGQSDPVRQEIALALANPKIRVIPVLVKGAAIPSPAEMPEDVARLASRNGIEVRGGAWKSDMARLTQTLRRLGALPASRWTWGLRVAALLLLVAIGGGAWALRTSVPTVPRYMEFSRAKELIEANGLTFKPRILPGSASTNSPSLLVAIDQRQAGGSGAFRGTAVEVEFERAEYYYFVCRGGGSLSAAPEKGLLRYELHQGPLLPGPMQPGSCNWATLGHHPNQDPYIRPIGFLDELPKRFEAAPGQLLAFCAFSDYALPPKSESLRVVTVEEYANQRPNGDLVPKASRLDLR
ncbi:MAG: toll/interleukin-1 receptor domain-containing protein [Rhodomicrobium sp.]|nr:toll/interleukin-1 receptor domain-containing protein [Rhodomicrobium sp.]